MYTITDIAPTDAEFIALIAALDAWQETLYPAESNHLLDLSQLPPQTVIALAIRSPQGEAVGCGAIVLSEEGFGEMKRVYIDPQHRGQQLGEKLLAALEAKARSATAIPCAWRPVSISMRPSPSTRATATRPAARLRRISPIRSACLWRNRCLPIFVQQRYKRLQLAGFGAPAPHQPGGQPAPLFGQRPGGNLLMAGHTLQHTARDQRQSGAGDDAGQHPVVRLHLVDPPGVALSA
jgi:putative acetyltransferase